MCLPQASRSRTSSRQSSEKFGDEIKFTKYVKTKNAAYLPRRMRQWRAFTHCSQCRITCRVHTRLFKETRRRNCRFILAIVCHVCRQGSTTRCCCRCTKCFARCSSASRPTSVMRRHAEGCHYPLVKRSEDRRGPGGSRSSKQSSDAKSARVSSRGFGSDSPQSW